jgi:hypothetical protein
LVKTAFSIGTLENTALSVVKIKNSCNNFVSLSAVGYFVASESCVQASQQSVHLTDGILRHFWALSTPEQNPALEVLSTPAHPQVTQTVRHTKEMGNSFQKSCIRAKYRKDI